MRPLLSPARMSDRERPPSRRTPRARTRRHLAAPLFLFLLGSACAHYDPPPPRAPVHHALRERPTAEAEKEDLKIHRAPPPEYGNKVVVCGEEAIPKG